MDFAVFSGHKMLGPSGVGVLYGRAELLEALPPFLTGGSMIEMVRMEGSTFAPPPQRFEAGVADDVAGRRARRGRRLPVRGRHGPHRTRTSTQLPRTPCDGLGRDPGRADHRPGRPRTDRGGAVSFVIDGIHPHDVGQVLDDLGVAVRVGHHCAWPLHRRFGVPASIRASFYLYNDLDEVDALVRRGPRGRRGSSG